METIKNEMIEQLEGRWNPISVKLTDGSECVVFKGENPTNNDERYFTIIPKGFIDIVVVKRTLDVLEALDKIGGSVVDFTILSPDKIKLSYGLI